MDICGKTNERTGYKRASNGPEGIIPLLAVPILIVDNWDLWPRFGFVKITDTDNVPMTFRLRFEVWSEITQVDEQFQSQKVIHDEQRYAPRRSAGGHSAIEWMIRNANKLEAIS